MKNVFSALFLTILLFSCSKEEVLKPEAPTAEVAQAFYKDNNISIKEVKATQTASGQVTFNFTTEYEKNLKSIEVYSGESSALLCEIYSEARNGTSQQLKKYTVVEKNIEVPVYYYMVKYTTINNEWSVSPLLKVELK